jgi:hypothetical protein
MPQEGFDGLIRALMKVEELAADVKTQVGAPADAEDCPPMASKIVS